MKIRYLPLAALMLAPLPALAKTAPKSEPTKPAGPTMVCTLEHAQPEQPKALKEAPKAASDKKDSAKGKATAAAKPIDPSKAQIKAGEAQVASMTLPRPAANEESSMKCLEGKTASTSSLSKLLSDGWRVVKSEAKGTSVVYQLTK